MTDSIITGRAAIAEPSRSPVWRILLASFLLSGCITSAEETKNLMDVWGDCVMAAVIRMDDGKTDPVSLAYGIAPQCAVQYQQFTSAETGNYITVRGQDAQRQLWRDKEVQMITSAVLIHRTKGKESASSVAAR
jgi:hypothetical protein